MVDGPDRVKLVKTLEKYHLALAIDDCSPIPTRLAFDVRERRFSPTMKQPAFCSATRSCPNLNRVLRVRIWTITCNDQPHQIDVDRVELINSDPLRVKSRPVDPNSTRGFCLHATEEEEESRPSGLTLSGLFPHASRPKGRTNRMVRLPPQIYELFTNDRKTHDCSRSDPTVKQLILKLDEQAMHSIVLEDLDAYRLLVVEPQVGFLKRQLEILLEENTYAAGMSGLPPSLRSVISAVSSFFPSFIRALAMS